MGRAVQFRRTAVSHKFGQRRRRGNQLGDPVYLQVDSRVACQVLRVGTLAESHPEGEPGVDDRPPAWIAPCPITIVEKLLPLLDVTLPGAEAGEKLRVLDGHPPQHGDGATQRWRQHAQDRRRCRPAVGDFLR